jgi:alpha-L-glutamate ligase-like protein
MIKLKRKLADVGVLGINRRNARYTSQYNSRHRYPLVDDKLRTKTLALKSGIAVPELYGVIGTEYEARRLAQHVHSHPEFVIKPCRGSGGSGILVINGRSKDMYRRADGVLMSRGEVEYHLSNVISGLYSLGGQPDKALIEYCVKFDPVFEAISYQGVPDIRVIVFLGVPVMGMVRLPTRMSGGKANLHQGAIGAGIDIASGATLKAVWHNEIVSEHPDTGHPVSGVIIPNWEQLLKIAAQCNEITGLGYIGVDQVLDKDRGPLILEMNARPGLNIQLANQSGLLPRLQLVERHQQDLLHIEDRIAFARKHFGA